jgi:Mg-chelatase subunit ChlD
MSKSIRLLTVLVTGLVLLLPALGAVREVVEEREIHFALDKALLDAKARTVLDGVAVTLQAEPGAKARLIGHTCDLADNPYNDRLARRRVDAAMRYLANKGIPADRMMIGSQGEEAPKYDNNDPAVKHLNRRVEIEMVRYVTIPPPTVTISADPASIVRGQSSNLSWSSANAASVTVSPTPGAVALAGRAPVQPNATTTYTAVARGAGGEASASTVVRVTEPAPPPVAEALKTTYANVVDANGNFLVDLGANRFRVVEDGRNREIVSVTYEAEGAASGIALVLDKSASLGAAIRDLKQAAVAFVEAKKPADRILAIAFSSDVVTLRTFDADKNALGMAIRGMRAGGNTRLYDALFYAAERMRHVGSPRIIVLMTDGVDEGGFGERGSVRPLEDALAEVKRVGASVYTIGLGRKVDEAMLRRIATETNGQSWFTTDPAELQAIYEKLASGLLRGRYKIVYRSTQDATGAPVVATDAGRVVGGN